MTVYAVFPERIRKEQHSKWAELSANTSGVKSPGLLILPEQVSISAMYEPLVVLAGYPIARIRNFRTTDWGIDLSVSIKEDTYLEPLTCGSPAFAHVWVKYLNTISQALEIPVKGDPSNFTVTLYTVPDKWIRERIAASRVRTEPPPVKDTVRALAYQLTRSDWRRNLQTRIKDRVASTEFINRMWVWVCQNVAKDNAFGELLDIIEAWMGKYAQFLNQDRLRGVVSNMTNDKPVERKLPVMVKRDCLPVPYGQREELFSSLKLVFEEHLQDLEMPPTASDELWHKANTEEFTRRVPIARELPANLTEASKGFIPMHRQNRRTINLTNGTKILTVANTQFADEIMRRIFPVIDEYFSEVRDQINLAV